MTYGVQMSPEIENLQEALLLGRDVIQINDRRRPAARAAIKKGDFLDLRERGQDFDDAQIDPFVDQPAAQERTEQQRQDAVECVNPDLLVRPVMERPPADEMRILHPLERFLDVMLTAIGPDDLLIAPGDLIGKKNVLPEEGALETRPGGLIQAVGQMEDSFSGRDLDAKEFLHVASGENGLDLLLGGFPGDGLARFGRMGQMSPKLTEFVRPGADFPKDRGGLGEKQLRIERDHDRPLRSQDLLAGPPGQNPLQILSLQRSEAGSGNLDQVGMLGRG